MANKNDNYYFINGNELESTTLCIPYKDGYYKNVRDLSDMDLATIELGVNLKDALKEANPTIKLNTHNYIGKYPYAQGIKIYKPIEIFKENESTTKIVNKFRELSEERNYNYYNGNNLELTNQGKVLSLVNLIISSFNDSQKRIVFSKKSSIGKVVKANHIDNKYLYERQISNYTQIRNLLICYLHVKSGRNIPENWLIKRMAESLENIKRLYPEDPKAIKEALEEYKRVVLGINHEEEIKKAEAEYAQKIQEDYHQMTLFDVFPCKETAEICRDIKTRK